MKKIAIDTWKRATHYAYYKDFDFPLFSISADLDITSLIHHLKRHHAAFFPNFLYLMMKAMNRIDEFKYRVRNDEVVLHDLVHPSFTVLNDEELFVFCTTDYTADQSVFVERVKKDIENAKAGLSLEDEPGKDDLVFVSSLPWVSFTSVTHPIDTKHPDSIPRVTFGKYREVSGRIQLPISVYVHHGLCDGLHVARFLEYIQEAIMEFVQTQEI